MPYLEELELGYFWHNYFLAQMHIFYENYIYKYWISFFEYKFKNASFNINFNIYENKNFLYELDTGIWHTVNPAWLSQLGFHRNNRKTLESCMTWQRAHEDVSVVHYDLSELFPRCSHYPQINLLKSRQDTPTHWRGWLLSVSLSIRS